MATPKFDQPDFLQEGGAQGSELDEVPAPIWAARTILEATVAELGPRSLARGKAWQQKQPMSVRFCPSLANVGRIEYCQAHTVPEGHPKATASPHPRVAKTQAQEPPKASNIARAST